MSTEQDTAQAGTGGSRVLVVGGGVIGLSSAYHLARAGHAVTLLEKRSACGRGASWGNAGWIVPSLAQPFNTPGAAAAALASMVRRDGPLAIRRAPTPSFLRWGLAFLRASRPVPSAAAQRTLAHTASRAADQIRELAEELPLELHRTGLLVPFRSREALESYRASHRSMEDLGYRGRMEILGSGAVHEREPALAEDVVGGIHLLDELSVRPDALTGTLADGLRAAGGQIVTDAEVTALTATRPGQWTCRTRDGRRHEAEAVVVAAGERSDAVLAGAGVRIALQPGRGCSVILPAGVLPLRQAVKIAEHQVACTPFDSGEVRVSGSFDLVRPEAPTDTSRMAAVLRSASSHLPELAGVDPGELEIWSGARPCTPDSVPLVGPIGPERGLFVATGHGTLGMTLAVGAGRMITQHLTAADRRR